MSLVDKTAVVGWGAWILTVPLIVGVVFSWSVGRVFLWTEERPGRRILRLALLLVASLVAGIFFVLYSRLLHSGQLSIQIVSTNIGSDSVHLRNRQCSQWVIDNLALKDDLNSWPDIVLPASIFIAAGVLGGYLIYRSFRDRTNMEETHLSTGDYRFRFRFFKEGVSDGWINLGILTTYVMSVVSVVALAYFLQVTLPYMWYTSTVAEDQGSNRQGTESGEGAGRLLGHSNGYWYVISQPVCTSSVTGESYESQGEERKYYRSIIAIPDKNAVDVQIIDR